MSTTTVTKSIRISAESSSDLAQLSKQTLLSESALMRKWILEGIERQKLDYALKLYMERKVDLREGAAIAGISFNQFMDEVEQRNIVILDETGFSERLRHLADVFDVEPLKRAIEQVEAEEAKKQAEAIPA